MFSSRGRSSRISTYDYRQKQLEKLKSEIESKGKEYILNVDENQYKEYLFEQYKLEPLDIIRESEVVYEPTKRKETVSDHLYRGSYQVDAYIFPVAYIFTGSYVLFNMQSDKWLFDSDDVEIGVSLNMVSFTIKIIEIEKKKEVFFRKKAEILNRLISNSASLNQFVEKWNNELPGQIKGQFDKLKKKYIEENEFFRAINVNINKETDFLFTVPSVKKKIIPQPVVVPGKTSKSEPIISQGIYEDILQVSYNLGKSMEKKPSVYRDKDEEALRDLFVMFLETRYDGTTATGETFNLGGKADILLKYAPDGSNLFVAECKIWHGASEFQGAISQLFDRYLTWRDSKAALILFVRNANFSTVLTTIKNSAKDHPYFVKHFGDRGESSFTYHFRLPQDADKIVHLEIIAFHFDKSIERITKG